MAKQTSYCGLQALFFSVDYLDKVRILYYVQGSTTTATYRDVERPRQVIMVVSPSSPFFSSPSFFLLSPPPTHWKSLGFGLLLAFGLVGVIASILLRAEPLNFSILNDDDSSTPPNNTSNHSHSNLQSLPLCIASN